MLKRLKEWFTQENVVDAESAADASYRAAALLLLEVVRADFATDANEVRTVDAALQGLSGLSSDEAQRLRKAAGMDLDNTISLHGALEQVNQSFDPKQKRELMRWMWQVAFADGEMDSLEEHRIRKLSELLYVPHSDFIQTKLEVRGDKD